MTAPGKATLYSGNVAELGTIPAGQVVLGADQSGDIPFFKVGSTLTYLGFTDEQVQDIVGAMADNTADVSMSYNDTTGKVSFAINNSKVTLAMWASGVLDTDGTMAANSNTRVPSQAAVVTYLANRLAALDVLMFKGAIDCSANPNYPAADAGHFYKISVAGKIGGGSGVNVEAGDTIYCTVDGSAAGTQAAVGASWVVVQVNIDGAVVGPASATDGAIALFDGATGKLLKNSTAALAKTFLALVKGDVGLGNVDNLQQAPITRNIATTLPLTGGGTLAADRTLAINAASASASGSQSPGNFAKQRDQYTDVVNDLGIDPTGATDATTILNNWHTSLPAAGGGRLYIPPNTRMRVDGPVAFSKDNITVFGGDRRSSIIGTGNATNNQFNVTGDSCTFQNLRFEAGTTAQNLALRSAGYCVEIQAASNGSNILGVDAIGHWSGINLEGCQLPTIDDFNMREYGALATAGALIRVNTNSAGGDTVIRRLQSDNGSNISGYAGVRVVNTASLIMEACNIIHATEALAINTANAGTVPSIKATDCFFDNGTYGLRFNPTGTGVWYRSEFVNCWFGSNSVAGIGFSSAQFEGIEFTNCKILGNPVGVQATSGGGKWTLNGGCVIAGSSTAGIDLSASTNHYPMIQGCRIGTSGAFGVNAIGIRVNAGAFKGLVIQGNDVTDNTSALSLGAVTISGGTAADYQRFRIVDNPGINPRGSTGIAAPAVPAINTPVTNTTGFRLLVIAKMPATTTTTIIVNGVTSAASAASALIPITLEPGSTIAFGVVTAASWTWSGM